MISEDEQCSLDVEIQSLKAIFAEELEVNRAEDEGGTVESLVVQMSPESSKGEKQQFVRFEIVLEIPKEYPQAVPKIALRNVRGLSEEAQARTKEYMQNRAEELSGNAMLFELIQVAKEQLTSENTPSIPCSICLFSFDAEDSFSRTPCFHFFHTHCLAKHVQHTFAQKDLSEDKASLTESSKENQQEVLCPVCRLAIPFKESDPEQFPIPKEALREQEEVVITPELREMQKKMADLYSEQLAKGSIIDLEAEKNKFFIEISNTPDIQVLSSSSLSPSQAKQSNDDPATSDSTNVAQDHQRKYYNLSSKKLLASNYEKKHQKDQVKNKASKTEHNAWEEEDTPATTYLSEESERPQRAPPYYKQYRRRDDQRFNKDRNSDPNKSVDGNGDVLEGERNNQQFEKKGRRRNQFPERKFKPNRTDDWSQQTNQSRDGEVDESGTYDKGNDETSVDDSNSRGDNRAFKKKKQKRPKNLDGTASNQEPNAEGVTEENTQLTDEHLQKNTSAPHYRKYNPRNNYGESRSYRQYNYNRGGKRFYTERQPPGNVNEGEEGNSTSTGNNADNVDEVQAQTGRNTDNRYRNTNYRYRNSYSKNKYQDYRYKDGRDKNESSVDTAENDANDNTENVEEPPNYVRNQNPRRYYQGGGYRKPRDPRYGGRNQHSETDNNTTHKNSESETPDCQNQNQESNGNRRFQKSYSNESESSEAHKEREVSSPSEQTSNSRSKYDNPKKTQKNLEHEPNLTDGSLQASNKQFNQDYYKNQTRRRPKYGYNPNYDPEERDTPITHEENVENVDESNKDYPPNKSWSDVRTNRRDNRNNNYAWKDRNRFPRYHGQHQNRSSTYPVKPDVSAMPSKAEPTVLKQNIRPFTANYNSATQDAQPVVSIPPPF